MRQFTDPWRRLHVFPREEREIFIGDTSGGHVVVLLRREGVLRQSRCVIRGFIGVRVEEPKVQYVLVTSVLDCVEV